MFLCNGYCCGKVELGGLGSDFLCGEIGWWGEALGYSYDEDVYSLMHLLSPGECP